MGISFLEPSFSSFVFSLSLHVSPARPEVSLSLGSNLLAGSIKEGDDVYFDCRASALPPVTRLEWFHNVSGASGVTGRKRERRESQDPHNNNSYSIKMCCLFGSYPFLFFFFFFFV